jgi:predicted nucleic acid-binding protein
VDLYYYDSSAFVKLYVEEAGSDRALEAFEGASTGEVIISRLVPLEVTSALVRRSRNGDFDDQALNTALRLLDDDVGRRCRIVEVGGGAVLRATGLVRQYALRAADAVQLACALLARGEFGSSAVLVFVSSDRELNAAARAEGLAVLDPAAE